LVCYSTDPSKPHLVRDPDCPNPKVWAQEIEDAVLGDLFSFALDRDATQPAAPEQDVLAVLRSRLAAQDTRLKRLYTLYAQEENELLRETIGEHLRERGRLQEQLASEEESHRQGKAVAQTRRELKRLSGVWEELDLREKRGVLRALVRRVVVTDGNVHIDYTF
jgi:site-specific DNA recombinase